jgi:hypothetical protein
MYNICVPAPFCGGVFYAPFRVASNLIGSRPSARKPPDRRATLPRGRRHNLILTPLNPGRKSCGHEAVHAIVGVDACRTGLPPTDAPLLIEIHQEVPGATKSPDYDRSQWQEVSCDEHPGYAFVEYRRATAT